MLAMFTTCKPFRGRVETAQRNTLRNWTLLEPGSEIIVFGDEEGAAEVCEELGLNHVPEVERSGEGLPLVSALIAGAEAIASNPILVFSDADVLFHGLAGAAEAVSEIHEEFVLTGLRRCVEVDEELEFAEGWQAELLERAWPAPPCAVDYFCFSKGLWPRVPPFAMARFAWDNWLIEDALQRGKAVVDATAVVLSFHQEHVPVPREGRDYARNRALFGGDPTAPRGFVTHATWLLDEKGLREK